MSNLCVHSHKVRTVLDIEDFFYIVTEFLGCSCKKTFVSTDQRIIDQLPIDLALKFPAILTSKYAYVPRPSSAIWDQEL